MARFVEIVKQYPDQAQVDLCVEIEVPGLWLGGTEMGSINATERSAKYKAQVVEYDDVREFPGPIPSRARPGESVVYWYSILCNLYTQWIHQPKPREERRIPSASYASWTLQSTKIQPVIGCSCRDWLRPKLEEIVAVVSIVGVSSVNTHFFGHTHVYPREWTSITGLHSPQRSARKTPQCLALRQRCLYGPQRSVS